MYILSLYISIVCKEDLTSAGGGGSSSSSRERESDFLCEYKLLVTNGPYLACLLLILIEFVYFIITKTTGKLFLFETLLSGNYSKENISRKETSLD